ncbi:MAG TPA: hypothetical protein VEZ14_04130 [Dehalococcoidia bacterium]|nr:hypothetical protein [Dehalococcoidia bacterium]
MTRTLVLLDVTAMSGDAVCVAGIDLDTRETLRLNDPPPTRTMLRRLEGLAPGDVIRVDWKPVRRPTPPHVEDGEWAPRSLKKIRVMAIPEIVALLSPGAFDSVEDAFGGHFYTGGGGNHAWKPSAGSRSLATIRTQYVRADERAGKLRITIRDERNAYLRGIPFQDLAVRLHATECRDCADSYLRRVREEFDGNRVLVRVGLTRSFAPDDDRPQGCWLQVTNVFGRPRQHFA